MAATGAKNHTALNMYADGSTVVFQPSTGTGQLETLVVNPAKGTLELLSKDKLPGKPLAVFAIIGMYKLQSGSVMAIVTQAQEVSHRNAAAVHRRQALHTHEPNSEREAKHIRSKLHSCRRNITCTALDWPQQQGHEGDASCTSQELLLCTALQVANINGNPVYRVTEAQLVQNREVKFTSAESRCAARMRGMRRWKPAAVCSIAWRAMPDAPVQSAAGRGCSSSTWVLGLRHAGQHAWYSAGSLA